MNNSNSIAHPSRLNLLAIAGLSGALLLGCGEVEMTEDAAPPPDAAVPDGPLPDAPTPDAPPQPDAYIPPDAPPTPDGYVPPDAYIPPDATITYNYAFVSPVARTGALGGLSGADTLCATWAANAGIPGTYRAILSTTTVHAATRLAGARGWIRPDGRPVADLAGNLFGSPWALAPIRLGPNGDDLGPVAVWSASNNGGTLSSNSDCSGWASNSSTLTARYGFSNTTSEWLDRGAGSGCNSAFHIYCFQVDHNSPLNVAAFAEDGRRMFVTSGNFVTSTGLAGADALCAADAAANPALSGSTFLAFLATNGASAASRFTSSSTPIVRPDGLRIANNFGALINQDLVHPPSLRAYGTTYDWRVFTGAETPTENGTAATTCNGWTDSTSGNVTEGFVYSTSLDTGERQWFGNSYGTCSNHSDAMPVYCLEVEN